MAFTKNVNVYITLIIFAIIVIDEYSNANENSDAIGPEEYCNNGGFKLPLATKSVERRKEFISSIKFPFNLSHSTDNFSLDQLKQKLKSKLVEESTSTSSSQEINPDNAKNFEFRQNQHDKSIQEEHDTNYNLNTESELSFAFKFDEVKKVPTDYTQLLKERSQTKDSSNLNRLERNMPLNIHSNLIAESSYGTDGFNPGVTNSSDFNQHQLNYQLSEEYERYYNSNTVFDLPLEYTPYDDTRNPIDSTEIFNVQSQPADKSIQEEHDTNYNLNTESELSFTFKFDEVKKVPIDYTQLLKERSQIKDHSSLNQPELNINLNIDSNLAESSYGTDGFNPGVTNSSDFNQHQLNYPLSEEYERYYNSNAVFDLPLGFTPYDDTRNPIDSTEFFNVHSQPAAIKNPIEFLYTNTPSSTTYAPNYQSHYYKSNNDPTL